jgi:hypothetical protein
MTTNAAGNFASRLRRVTVSFIVRAPRPRA